MLRVMKRVRMVIVVSSRMETRVGVSHNNRNK